MIFSQPNSNIGTLIALILSKLIQLKIYPIWAIAIFVFSLGNLNAQTKPTAPKAKAPPVDLVFCVDISSSTGGILASVKLNFWEIINEMNRLKPVPDFRIALVCLGRPSFGEENAYVKIVSNLTKDIDKLAFELFSIKESTAKGSVLYGDAIHTTVNEIKWSKEPNAIKLVFLVGNGGVYNGYNIIKACEDATEQKIVFNSLYFKTYENKKEVLGWQDIARLTGGSFNIIGLKEPGIVFDKGYDNDLLLEASDMINSTYVPYGKEGIKRRKMQQFLDDEAKRINENSNEARAFFKASSLYQDKNNEWDLVDMTFNSNKTVNFGTLDRDLMDDNTKRLNDKQLGQYLAVKTQQRIENINILKMLTTKREEFLKMKKRQMELYRFGDTFYGVVNRTLVKACTEKGYIIE